MQGSLKQESLTQEPLTQEKVLILDFGSQYTQLIARRVRELGVYSEIKACNTTPSQVELAHYQALILSGGPASVNDADAPTFDKSWINLNIPVLGICYGFQLLAKLHGASLRQSEKREYGYATIAIKDCSDLFFGFEVQEKTSVWMSHGDHIGDPPEGFKVLAMGESTIPAAMGNPQRKLYGIQFHPEVFHTPRGMEILSNFLFRISGLKGNWTPTGFIETCVKNIKEAVQPQANVICGISGGVDSAVAAVLVNKAIGNRLYCLFVDNGLLRKHEAEEVMRELGKDGLGLNVKKIDASKEFLEELKGVTEPEAKRKIIGKVFIEIFEKYAGTIQNVTHLVQGTLYPDVIESTSTKGPSAVIKSHHNVGGLPEKMNLKLIEPLRELFKDEVRALGSGLGVPNRILGRQPFPGPGLAIRVVGPVTPERLHVLREADYIFQEEIMAQGLYGQLWQAFAVILPVHSVGVMGDGRTYDQTIALRAVTSQDGMTADWEYLPQDLLRRVSNRIVREVKGINRVVFDISSKPPATIEWE